MKKLKIILSYLLVAVLASMLTSALNPPQVAGETKLTELENLLVTVFIGETDRTEMQDAAAEAMVNSLGDRWSHYIPADEYGLYLEQMSNSYVGIGITIQLLEDGQGISVLKVNEGGPADEAGMLAGDIIIAIEGQSTGEMTVDEARNLVRGEENTSVTMTVRRGTEEIDMSIIRKQVQTPVATAQMLEGNIGLITIVNFDSRCAKETIAAIEQMLEQGATKLIFDVRNNPGGYAHELVKLLDYILPEGELFRTVDYMGREDVDMSDADCIEGIPMAVLINGDSYSAAEFFAAALSEYDYAIIVGEPTVGKGYFQRTYELSDGSAVGVSVGKYFTPEGKSLAEEGGLVPDVLVTVDLETAAAIYAGTLDPAQDPQVQAAVEALNG